MKETKIYSMALNGRHPTPATDAVFPDVIPGDVITNPQALKDMAMQAIPKDCDTLDIFVAGLTVCVGAVVAACMEMGINLVLHHYDRESGAWYPQTVIGQFTTCPVCGRRGALTWGYHCPWCGG